MSGFPKIKRAILIGVTTEQQSQSETESLLSELTELVSNLDIEIAGEQIVKLRKRNSALLLGKGKTQEIIDTAHKLDVDAIIFDESLSPAQQRNWEKNSENSLIISDRQEIILQIFQQRARTKEATLQVELASLEYQLPRMKRAWTHLGRQKGGSAAQRDAGETQLEMDQRMIRGRISRVKQELTAVVKQRAVERTQRLRVPLPTAAIVGYTNAGKSSLLNKLTESKVFAADKLFATLDPTTRRTTLPSGQILLLTDTVGFVRRLPHRLVEAFKATLEEALVANFLIHIIDASHPNAEAHYKTTMEVLKELGADDKRIIKVFNKVDNLEHPSDSTELRSQYPEAVFMSIKTGENIPLLLRKCEAMIEEMGQSLTLMIPHDRYDLINLLHQSGAVSEKEVQDDGIRIQGVIPKRLLRQVEPFAVKKVE